KRHWVEPDGTSSTEQSIVSANEPAMEEAVTEPATRTIELKALLTKLSGKDYSNASDHVTFVELGFESLFLTQVSLAIARRFGVQVAFRQLLGELSTLASLAAYLDMNTPPANIEPLRSEPASAAPQTAPLTEAQQEV